MPVLKIRRDTATPEPDIQVVTSETESSRGRLWFMRFIGLILPVLIIVGSIVALMVMSSMKPEPEKTEDPIKAQPVTTALVVQEPIRLTVSAQGEVQPRTQINLVSEVGGRITYMSPKFIEGGHFNKGDVLLRINPADYELNVVQARANIAQAETALERERSESDLARQDWSELGGVGTPSRLTLREPQMAEANARLEAAKAQLSEAELQLSRTSIVAPFTGRMTKRFVNQGEYVSVSKPLGEAYATNIMDVRLPMTNNDLARTGLQIGFEASKSTPAIPVILSADVAGQSATWQAHIVRTDSRFDPQNRVLFAYAEVVDPFGKAALDGVPLAPGLFVSAKIEGKTQEDALVIPREALRGNDQVFVVNDDNILSIKTVQVIATDRTRAILSSGVTPSERVVTSPIRGAAEGMEVRVVSRMNSADDTAENDVTSESQDAPESEEE